MIIADRVDLFDLHAAVEALELAMEAIRKTMEGHGQEQRDQLDFQLAVALDKLERIKRRRPA